MAAALYRNCAPRRGRSAAGPAIFGRVSQDFKGLRRHSRAIRIRPILRGSKTAGRGACGRRARRRAISGRGFNLFKPLRRRFRATRNGPSTAARSPIDRRRGGSAASGPGGGAAPSPEVAQKSAAVAVSPSLPVARGPSRNDRGGRRQCSQRHALQSSLGSVASPRRPVAPSTRERPAGNS